MPRSLPRAVLPIGVPPSTDSVPAASAPDEIFPNDDVAQLDPSIHLTDTLLTPPGETLVERQEPPLPRETVSVAPAVATAWRDGMTQSEIETYLKSILANKDRSVMEDHELSDAEIAAYLGVPEQILLGLHEKRGITSEEFLTMPTGKLARAIWRSNNPKPDHPGEALNFRVETWKNEQGVIPENALVNAAAHFRQRRIERPWAPRRARENGRLDGRRGIASAAAGIDSVSWTELGPGSIGGRVRAVVIHPATPNTMWLGSVSGGIWKTTDGGATWNVLDDFMANLAVSSLAMSPTDVNTLYAGTGEGFYSGDAIRGAGIFKTTDGGANWAQLATTANSNFYYVNRIAISPDGSTILAATRTGIWRSTDGGATWSQRLAVEMLDVDFNPGDNLKAVCGGWYGRGYYSVDGGVNWTQAAGLPFDAGDFYRRVEVAYAPTDPSIVFASVNVSSGSIYKSVDGGVNYAQTHTGSNYLGNQGWYDNVIWVDPTNPDTLIVGGIDLWKSPDRGVTLIKISQWWSAPSSAHADHHWIGHHPSFDGAANKTVFFGNDGGIYKAANVYTTSGITGWQHLNNNLRITQFYGGAGNDASGRIYGGTQDNGTLRFNGDTQNWNTAYGGDGGHCAADQSDSRYLYGEYVYLQIHRSTNGGVSGAYIHAGITDAGSNANFIAPFILDPNNDNTMLAGGLSLWRSTDVKAGAPAWSAVKASNGSYISAIAAAKGNSDVIWVGHNNGDVYMTSNGTAGSPTWSKVDGTLPNRYVYRIVIDPNNHSRVFVAFAGFNANNLWRTTDGGSSWYDINTNAVTKLPTAPIRGLALWEPNTDSIYAGTEVGVYASEDGGVNWSATNDGPANVSVDQLFWMGLDTLVAATHGRGMYRIRVATTVSHADQANSWYVNDNSRTNDSFCFAVGGASNNGMTPSTPKSTIAAALALASAGDTIYVDAGIYSEAVTITKDSVTIVGAGWARTMLDPPGAYSTAGVVGISASNRVNLGIRELKVTGAYEGIKFTNVDRSTISGVECKYATFGVSLNSGSDTNTIFNCNLVNNYHVGVYLKASRNNTVDSSITSYNTNAGIFTIDTASRNTFTNNVSNGNTYGIYVYGGSESCVLTGNKIASSGYVGIYLNRSPGHVVRYNRVDSTATNLGTGIFLIYYVNDAIIDSNVCSGNALGVYIWGGCESVSITNNRLVGNRHAGIIIDSCPRALVQGNTSQRNTNAGLFMIRPSDGAFVENNDFDTNVYGVYVYSSPKNCRIVNNRMRGNSNSGILFDGARSTTVSDNYISGNSNAGINMIRNCRDTFLRNVITNNTNYGIASSTSSEASIESNIIASNGTGIYMVSDTGYVLEHNLIRQSGSTGLYLKNISGCSFYQNVVESSAQLQINITGATSNIRFNKNNIATAAGVVPVSCWISSADMLDLARNWWGTRDTYEFPSSMTGTAKSKVAYYPFRLDAVDTRPGMDSVAPTPPAVVTAAQNGANTIRVSWSAVGLDEESDEYATNLGGYSVWRGKSADTRLWELAGSTGAGAGFLDDAGLPAGTTYYYRVTSFDNAAPWRNESRYSDSIATAATPPGPPPPEPPPSEDAGMMAPPPDVAPPSEGPLGELGAPPVGDFESTFFGIGEPAAPGDSPPIDTGLPNAWFVNDASRGGDSFTTAIGNDANSGLTASAPKRTIGAVMALASDGDSIYIDAGTYAEAAVASKDSITMIGVSTAVTRIDPPGDPGTAGVRGINSNGRLRLGVSNVQVFGADEGIALAGGGDAAIIGCELRNNRVGLRIQGGSSNNDIHSNTIQWNSGTGVEITGSAGNTVESNAVGFNSNTNVYVTGSSSFNTIVGNTCGRGMYGIYVDAASNNNVISGNSAHENSYIGICLSAAANNVIRVNAANKNASTGIFAVNASTGNRIEGNTTDSQVYGVYLYGSSQNTVCTSYARGNSHIGICLAGGSSNAVESAFVAGNGAAGIFVNGETGDSIYGAVVGAHDYYGIYLYQGSANTLRSNTVSCTGSTGIFVSGTVSPLLEANRSFANETGIAILNATSAMVRQNRCESNSVHQLAVRGNCAGSLIYSNVLLGDASASALNVSAPSLDARRNWWGTTDSTQIRSVISGAQAGTARYIPYALTEVNTEAGYDVTAPSAPGGIAATSVGGVEVRLTWAAPTTNEDGSVTNLGLAGYRIYRSKAADTILWDVMAEIDSSSPSWKDSGLTAGQTWYYKVTSFDAALPMRNESWYSNQTTAVTLAAGPYSWYVNDASIVGNVYTTAAGSDQNDGDSSSRPVLTLGRLSALIKAGDTVYIDVGTYADTLSVETNSVKVIGGGSGSAGTVISFGDPSAATGAAGVRVRNASSVVVRGVRVTGCYYGIDLDNAPSAALVNAAALSNGAFGLRVNSSDNVSIKSFRSSSNSGGGISIDGTSAGARVRQAELSENAGYAIAIAATAGACVVEKSNLLSSSAAPDSVVYKENASIDSFARNWWNTANAAVIAARVVGPGAANISPNTFRLGRCDTTTAGDSVAPRAPAVVTASAPDSTRVDLFWSAVSTNEEAAAAVGLSGYRLYRAANALATAWTQIGDVAAGTTTASDTAVLPGDSWYYRVTSYDAAVYPNESQYSDSIANALVPAAPVPPPPAPSPDFTGDSRVDAADLPPFVGRVRNPTAYSPVFDVGRQGRDGKIDEEDLFEFATQYGK